MSRRAKATSAAIFVTAALWLLLSTTTLAQIAHGGPAPTRTPDLGPSPTPAPGATPTIDRLAAPPTVIPPTQADEGAQLYWLHCQPCHGDQGQGLTDEWRMEYPPEEQNCWTSGCHGNRPYDQNVILPTSVPPLIGPAVDRIMGTEGAQVLTRFQTLEGVYSYMSVTMPYFFPGELSQEEYLAILAHLARENGVWDGATLTRANLTNYPTHPGGAVAAPEQTAGSAAPPAVEPVADQAQPPAPTDDSRIGTMGIALAVLSALLIAGVWIWRKRAR